MLFKSNSRLPRFRRSSITKLIQITTRDREIIQSVFQHRFLRSTHLHLLLGGGRQGLLRRLQRLFHHGYLDRPRAQIERYCAGSQAMVYGIGHQSIKLLEREWEIPRRKMDWTAKNRTATRYFLEHTLAVADVMVALEVACRKHAGVELVHHHAMHGEPLKWSVRIERAGASAQIGVVPDRVFGLRCKDKPGGVVWYFLEADRATMPVHRHGLKQTSVFRKLLAYHETWRQRALEDSFPRFRVLTVTTTPARVKNLIETSRSLNKGKGSGLLLFADEALFQSAESLLTKPLHNGRGEEVKLFG